MPLRGTSKKLFHSLSNYCGLGGYGIPQNEVDAICAEHDQDYEKIYKQHGYKAAYLEYNWADEKMARKLTKYANTLHGRSDILLLGTKFFTSGKKALLQSNINEYDRFKLMLDENTDMASEDAAARIQSKSFLNMPSWYKTKPKQRKFVGDEGFDEWAETVRYELKANGKWPPQPGDAYYDVGMYFNDREKLGLQDKRPLEETKENADDIDMDKVNSPVNKRPMTDKEHDEYWNWLKTHNNDRTVPPKETEQKTKKPKPTIEGQGTLDGFIGTGKTSFINLHNG